MLKGIKKRGRRWHFAYLYLPGMVYFPAVGVERKMETLVLSRNLLPANVTAYRTFMATFCVKKPCSDCGPFAPLDGLADAVFRVKRGGQWMFCFLF